MLDERGWTRVEHELRELRLLRWISENVGRSFGDLPDFDESDTSTDAASLEQRQFIQIEVGMGGPESAAAFLKPGGEIYLRNIVSKIADRRNRHIACMDAFLDWLYDATLDGDHFPNTDNFLEDPRSNFYGEPFSSEEADRANGDLLTRGLISGPSSGGLVLRGKVEPSGKRIVEQFKSSVSASEAPRDSGNHHYTTHFNGPVSGQVAVGPDASQVQNNGFDVAELTAVLDAVRSLAEDIVDENDRAKLMTYLDFLRAEADEAEPDVGLIQTSLGRIKRIAAKVPGAAITGAVAGLAKYYAAAHGIPIGP